MLYNLGVRTHGWAGSVPADDDEAFGRVLDAAKAVIDQQHRPPRVAEVARDLGVTRTTVYRYVRDSDEILTALAARETGPFVDGLAGALAGETSPPRAVARAVGYVIDQLPRNAYLSLALSAGDPGRQAARITSPAAQSFAREMLRVLDVDWATAGFDDRLISLLAEHMLRLVQSFVLDPGAPPRHEAELDSYLDLWLVPCVEAITQRAGSARPTGPSS